MSDWYQAHFYLTAFLELNTTRQYGAMGGISSIPWDKVMYYADRLGLDDESARHFWLIIRDVDFLYVKEFNKKHEPKKPTGGTRTPLRTREPR